jgi:hypothetical protein
VGRVVRPHRYALAAALRGRELPGSALALHDCDNPLCVRVIDPVTAPAGALLHVVTGSQAQNMQRMGRLGRGGGRPAIPVRGEPLAARVRAGRRRCGPGGTARRRPRRCAAVVGVARFSR